ncbi:MAG: aminopeptidase [Spirochaetaceae bacterium]|nr:aminopeptidase [Spirochaetaceae bacterium]
MDLQKNLEKYATLILTHGINLKPGECFTVTVQEETLPLAREITKQAYQMGAKDVVYIFNDDDMTLSRYLYAKDIAFKEMPKFKTAYTESYLKEGYHRISLVTANPELLKKVDKKRLEQWQKVVAQASKNIRKYTMQNIVKWNVSAVASPTWAQAVFPKLSVTNATKKLWENIFAATRVNLDNPVAAWNEHDKKLKKYVTFLNKAQFKKLLYKGPGTDLEVGLVKNHIWQGGAGKTKSGVRFFANIPTEEIFTMPDAYGVNGTIKATKPLVALGNIIEDFSFTLKGGKIVEYKAKKGEDVLKTLLSTDEGALRFGEVALVPHDSPISNTNILFKNTLFDENASCHFAFGDAYADTVENGDTLTSAQKKKIGMNQSMTHVDFMVGGPELSVIGVAENGKQTPILEKGNWAF